MKRVMFELENFDGKYVQTSSAYEVSCNGDYEVDAKETSDFKKEITIRSEAEISVRVVKTVRFSDHVSQISRLKVVYQVDENGFMRICETVQQEEREPVNEIK